MGIAMLSAAANLVLVRGRLRFGFGNLNLNRLTLTNHFNFNNNSLSLSSGRGRGVCCLSETSESEIQKGADILDIRVGRIIKAWLHEEADSLYVEQVDVGESEPRIICSGLVNYIPLHQLQGLAVVVLANLKARNMRGVKSNGMLMAASDESHTNVELLIPPIDSLPGHRIWFGSQQHQLPPPASPNQIQKKKIWEVVQPHLKTDDSCVATLKLDDDNIMLMRTSAGLVRCNSLKNANIS